MFSDYAVSSCNPPIPNGTREESLPNWCRNYAIIGGRPEQIEWLLESISNFNAILPEPRSTGSRAKSDLVSWHQTNWGCDRNVDPDEIDVTSLSDSKIIVQMPTAWTPPTGIYSSLVHSGFSVEAYYFEPDLELIGIVRDQEHTPLSLPNIRERYGTIHQFVESTDLGQALHRYLGFSGDLE
jgi:hypothetical protein